MVAEVSSLVRVMNGGDANESGKSTAPITRDLLGGCCTLESKELDLDLQVPCGYEKRLDLKSGKIYLQRCNSSNSTNKHSLDLKLVSSSSNYQSVCTLDKVKSALERVEKENMHKKRSNSSSSIKDSDFDDEVKSSSFAAGCPCCLLYVLISTCNPRCPRCNSNVPLPVATKKPRIDLNISI